MATQSAAGSPEHVQRFCSTSSSPPVSLEKKTSCQYCLCSAVYNGCDICPKIMDCAFFVITSAIFKFQSTYRVRPRLPVQPYLFITTHTLILHTDLQRMSVSSHPYMYKYTVQSTSIQSHKSIISIHLWSQA